MENEKFYEKCDLFLLVTILSCHQTVAKYVKKSLTYDVTCYQFMNKIWILHRVLQWRLIPECELFWFKVIETYSTFSHYDMSYCVLDVSDVLMLPH